MVVWNLTGLKKSRQSYNTLSATAYSFLLNKITLCFNQICSQRVLIALMNSLFYG
jgi:hypothetical protein